MDNLSFPGNNVNSANLTVLIRILAIQELNLDIHCRQKTSNEDEAKKLNDIYQRDISERYNTLLLKLYEEFGETPDFFKS